MLWSAFHGLIAPEVPNCPQPVIDAQLLRTAIEFCTTTKVWVAELEPFSTELATGTYDLASPEQDSLVCNISQLWLNGELLDFIPLGQMSRYATHWPTDVGAAEGYTQINPTSVTIYKIPTTVSEVKLLGVLRPTITAAGVPDWIGEKYFDELVAGTKARLMAMVNVPWTNQQGSTLYAGIYKGDSLAVAQERAKTRSNVFLSAPAGGGA